MNSIMEQSAISDPDPAEALDLPDMLSYGNYEADLSEEHSIGLSDDYTDVTEDVYFNDADVNKDVYVDFQRMLQVF